MPSMASCLAAPAPVAASTTAWYRPPPRAWPAPSAARWVVSWSAASSAPCEQGREQPSNGEGGLLDALNGILFGRTGPRGGQHDGVVQTAAKSVARTIGSEVGRQLVRGVLGSLLGGGQRRR